MQGSSPYASVWNSFILIAMVFKDDIDYSVSETIQGQSLSLAEIIASYIRTGVAPAPLPLNQMEFNRDLSDNEMDVFDGHRLDHDLSELDESEENMREVNDRLQKLKDLEKTPPSEKPSEEKE